MRVVRTHGSLCIAATVGAIGWLVFGSIDGSGFARGEGEQSTIAIRLIEPSTPKAEDKAPAESETPAKTVESTPAKSSSSAGSNTASRAKEPAAVMLKPPATIDEPAQTAKKTPAVDKPATTSSKPASDEKKPAKDEPIKPIATAASSDAVEIETASFKGVTPGVTSVEDLEKAWGKAKETRDQNGSTLHLYSVEPFNRVEVFTTQGKVSSILIRFDKSFPANAVAQQLELSQVRPVLVSNELGEILGQAFPERGVLLAFEPSPEPGKASMNVSQIILEPVTAEPFVLRAETNLDTMAVQSLHDLDQAVSLQPGNARAHWLRARLLVNLGEPEKALKAGTEAIRLDPNNAQFRVTASQLLGQLGRFPDGIREAETAVKTSERRPHVKARALCLLGDLTASSTPPDYRKAIGYHMDAVKLADNLAADQHPAIRLAAKEVLIDAHLGAAHDIAWGNWKEKEKAVTRWLERATALADDLIKNEQGSEVYRFRVATRALAACVGARGEVDPNSWAENVVQVGEALIDASEDSARKAQIRWDLGTALYDALQVYQIRGDHDTAMKYGEKAIKFLEQGKGKQSASAAYLLGRIYFRIGAVYALRDQNHRTAVTWFKKAIPLLELPLPPEAAPDLGRHGETFVSMGVSFWESGERERAVQLTQEGLVLMEDAVKQGLLNELALTVAYANMATMHRHLGQNDTAEKFDTMAAKIKKTTDR